VKKNLDEVLFFIDIGVQAEGIDCFGAQTRLTGNIDMIPEAGPVKINVEPLWVFDIQ